MFAEQKVEQYKANWFIVLSDGDADMVTMQRYYDNTMLNINTRMRLPVMNLQKLVGS